jgi:hypothetical protein
MIPAPYRWVIVAAAGLIYDTLVSYLWFYAGSLGLGLFAFQIAMIFKPFPKTEAQQCPA